MKYIILLFIVFYCQHLSSKPEIDSLLTVLEETMRIRDDYDKRKELRIQNLKVLLEDIALSAEQIYQINKNIINEYNAYSLDSTLFYIEKNSTIANNLKNQFFIDESKLKLASLFASSGSHKESIDVLGSIDRKRLSDELLNDYYENYQKNFLNLSFYSLTSGNKKKYSSCYKTYTDSLLHRLEPGTEKYLAVIETRLRDKRQLEESLKINSLRLAMASAGTRNYSMIAFERSLSLELNSKRKEQIKYLILSAISDIQSSTKDNASLTMLAMLLFKKGEVERAHSYISFSFEDATFYNSRLRYILISNVLPDITKAYESRIEKQRTKLRELLAIISILGLFLLFTIIYIILQMKKLYKTRNELIGTNKQLKELNIELNQSNIKLEELYQDLSEANLVKEYYIGTFLNLLSNYIDKLDDYRKMVRKHIIAKKITDLYDKTKTDRIIVEELRLFYRNFDTTFLNIYPDFVEKVNNLLNEEGKIKLKNKNQLNTKLRILALIRLSIKDSSEIAKLLRYSVNTIYNYRVEIRNNANVPREKFEDKIMEIGISK